MSQRRPRSWQEMRDQEIKWLIERTGEGLETWNARVRESGKADEAGLRAWLSEQGVTGYPQMLLVMERFGYPDYLLTSAEDLIDNQYADRPATRPIYDALLTLLPEISVDLETRAGQVRLIRFEEPEPSRLLGLAWRSTSPRKRDFAEFGRLVMRAFPQVRRSVKLAS